MSAPGGVCTSTEGGVVSGGVVTDGLNGGASEVAVCVASGDCHSWFVSLGPFWMIE